MTFTTQCGENRHTDIANFVTLIHKKKLIHCVAIFTILDSNNYPPHEELKLICIGKFARRTWVNFTEQYRKNRPRCQQNKFHYAVWQLLLYLYREFPSKILSVHEENFMAIFTTLSVVIWFSTTTLGIFATLVYVFYHACGNIRHTKYGNNSHTIDFHTIL